MKRKRPRVYFDRKAEIARFDTAEERFEGADDDWGAVRGDWNRSSPQSWDEFITRWESRFSD